LLKHIEDRINTRYEINKKTTNETLEKLQGRRKILKREKIKNKTEMAKQACKRMQG
jgi:hypothetical protein